MAARLSVSLALVAVAAALLSSAAAQQCGEIPDPYNPGQAYDISELVNNVANYKGVYSTSADYELQFCRTLASTPDSIKCPPSSTMVCERFQINYNPVGIPPTTFAVTASGLTLTYQKGAWSKARTLAAANLAEHSSPSDD